MMGTNSEKAVGSVLVNMTTHRCSTEVSTAALRGV